MRIVLSVAALLSLSSCYSVGNYQIADPTMVSKIVPGESTKDDVLELMGHPTKVDFDPHAREKWLYSYSITRASGRQLIPIVGWFAAPDTENHSLTVLFDDRGIVLKVGGGQATSRDTIQGAGTHSSGKAADKPRRHGKGIAGRR